MPTLEGPRMPELVAIVYADESLADRAAQEMRRCGEDLLVDQDAFSVLVCERDGSCQLTTSRRPGAVAHWSKFWGVLLGAIQGGEESAALEVRFRSRLRALLRPGSSVLLLAVLRVGRQRLLNALSHFGGEAISCPLPVDLPQRWNVRGLRFDR